MREGDACASAPEDEQMINTDTIWSMLEEVNDPEVPVLSVVDLGIVREVRADGEEVEIVITPTYSGCPAMDVIRTNIRIKLAEHGYPNPRLTTVLSPAWRKRSPVRVVIPTIPA
jgi:ring-1,2-phenylacetyl-CoA epoxidase subunit PaaD